MRRRIKALPNIGRSRLSHLPSPRLPHMPRIGRTRLLLFLALLGPGLITANADNDAGGIATYSMAGGRYGYSMLDAAADHFQPGSDPGDGRPHGRGDRPGAGCPHPRTVPPEADRFRHGGHVDSEPGHDYL